MDMITDERRLSRSLSASKEQLLELNADKTGADTTLNHVDVSFSQDGLIPTHLEAENVFLNARNFPGSPTLGLNWREPRITSGHVERARAQYLDAASGATKGNYKSKTPISKLPTKLSPRAKTPTNLFSGGSSNNAYNVPPRNSRNSSMDDTVIGNSSNELETTVNSRLSSVTQFSQMSRPKTPNRDMPPPSSHNGLQRPRTPHKELPPPPATVTKDLTNIDMANFAPPTPIGRQPRSPNKPSVASQILGANRSAGRSNGAQRSESVPPSNRISMHCVSAHLEISDKSAISQENSVHSFNSSNNTSSGYSNMSYNNTFRNQSNISSRNHSGVSLQNHSGILSHSNNVSRQSRPEHRTMNHVRFNENTETQSYVEMSAAEEEGKCISPASTPSPTTHDLILDSESSPDTTPRSRGRRRPIARAAKRTAGTPNLTHEDEVKKTLSFEGNEANTSDNDMQVSYV